MRALLLCGLVVAAEVFGQSTDKPLTFEVASVKPSPPDSPGMFITPLAGGSLRMTGATLRNLIAYAYGVRGFQIAAGSDWMDADHFDIEARAESSDASASAAEQRRITERLRSLLADRFQLAVHRETREQPVYALVVAKGGPKIQESTEARGLIRRTGAGTITGQAVELRMLALNLSNELRRAVIDKTGLAGNYSFELKWAPSQAARDPHPAPTGGEPPSASDAGGPSIFTALTEQLGLRLESQRGPVEMLVIDRVEKPTRN